MEQFSASRMTVHRAIKELATEGHIYREQGRGSFVAKQIPRQDLLEISDIAEEIQARGGTYFSELRYLEREGPTPVTTHVFGPETANTVARSKVIHFENGLPLQLEDRYVNLDMAPDYLELNFSETSAHQYLIKVAPLQKAEHQLTAVLPNSEQQEQLQIQDNEPCLLLKRKTWSGDTLVSYAELLYPGSRYSFGGVFTPGTK
ncbi:histidine utilization repressor [Pseudodesulfovibrio sediminis]|uniref:Histidine utilization repressor n=2 Tax=Pseudodesulfovibrio sediminis TaxID=2810563 RepID=A0ABN6EXT5_9BACT|nr:histidine utilization repressor [Pseudodesulfovibrio sediminis]